MPRPAGSFAIYLLRAAGATLVVPKLKFRELGNPKSRAVAQQRK